MPPECVFKLARNLCVVLSQTRRAECRIGAYCCLLCDHRAQPARLLTIHNKCSPSMCDCEVYKPMPMRERECLRVHANVFVVLECMRICAQQSCMYGATVHVSIVAWIVIVVAWIHSWLRERFIYIQHSFVRTYVYIYKQHTVYFPFYSCFALLFRMPSCAIKNDSDDDDNDVDCDNKTFHQPRPAAYALFNICLLFATVRWTKPWASVCIHHINVYTNKTCQISSSRVFAYKTHQCDLSCGCLYD